MYSDNNAPSATNVFLCGNASIQNKKPKFVSLEWVYMIYFNCIVNNYGTIWEYSKEYIEYSITL
jgi:hypothetical protein